MCTLLLQAKHTLMQHAITTTQPFHFFYRQYKTTYKDLWPLVRVEARDIFKAAIQHDLEIVGPQHWHYYGADGLPDTIFTLEIGIPVAAVKTVPEPYGCKTLPAFKSVNKQYTGSWEQLPEVYAALIKDIQQQGLTMNGQQREIYIQCNFDDPSAHITQVQIGLQ